jgi:polyhydroxybutyrate depolymerase
MFVAGRPCSSFTRPHVRKYANVVVSSCVQAEMKRIALVAALLTAGELGGAEATPGRTPADLTRSLEAGGRARTSLVHVPPSYDGSRSVPLVLVLHGGGGNAAATARMTGFSALSDEKGFLAVYPNGTGRFKDRLLTWNAGRCCGLAMDQDVNDGAFIRKLLAVLKAEWRIDPARVFATGISNGGMMSYRLGCELSDELAAIAPVAGALGVEGCAPAGPVSVIAFHGTDDQHVLYGGGKPAKQADRHPRIDRSVAESVGFWVKHDGCRKEAKRRESGSIVRETWTDGRGGVEVELVTITGGGHVWPGGEKWAPWAGDPTKEISATRAMWEFFASHPKKP